MPRISRSFSLAATGVGKSSLFEDAAKRLGIGLIVRDLSLMEPVDLIGIPKVGPDGRTIYAPPAFLPTEGEGLFVLEELNRAPRYVQVPALQLLTARRLNDFVFPAKWLPCAAINDGDEYQVDLLDPALLSRFLKARIEPDVVEWIAWARGPGHGSCQGDRVRRADPRRFQRSRCEPSGLDLCVEFAEAVGARWPGPGF